MKKLIIALAIVTIVTSVSFAQVANTPQPNAAANVHVETPEQTAQRVAANAVRAKEMATNVTNDQQKNFGLNNDQYKKAYEANLECFTKLMENRNNPNKRHFDPKENFGYFDERDAKLKTIMTDEQYTKYYPTRPMQQKAPQNQESSSK